MSPTDVSERSGAWRRQRLAQSSLYVCTDLQRFLTSHSHSRSTTGDGGDGAGRGVEGGGDAEAPPVLDETALSHFYTECFTGGVDIIQVRDKTVGVQTELRALELLREAAEAHGALSAANDRADVALVSGVDVFHGGQEDLTTAQMRRILGPEVMLGRSCRSEEHVRVAVADEGLDYFCTGPVWETPTKPGRAAVGLDLPRFAAQLTGGPSGADGAEATGEAAGKPFFAIGGIDAGTVAAVLSAGARRIVVVRAVTQAADPRAAAGELKASLNSA